MSKPINVDSFGRGLDLRTKAGRRYSGILKGLRQTYSGIDADRLRRLALLMFAAEQAQLRVVNGKSRDYAAVVQLERTAMAAEARLAKDTK